MRAGCTRKSSGVRRFVTVCAHKNLWIPAALSQPRFSHRSTHASVSRCTRRRRIFVRRVNDGLQGRSGWSDRQCRPGDARHPRRTPVSGGRGRGNRIAAQSWHGGVLRRQDPQGQSDRQLRFLRRRHLPDVGGRCRVQGMVAEDRGQGRGGDRQFVGLADGSGRAADRAGSECRRGRRLHQEEHHRQPELLDRAARRRAEAAARLRRRSSASWSRPINRCRAPARKAWTSCSRRPRPSTPPARSR